MHNIENLEKVLHREFRAPSRLACGVYVVSVEVELRYLSRQWQSQPSLKLLLLSAEPLSSECPILMQILIGSKDFVPV